MGTGTVIQISKKRASVKTSCKCIKKDFNYVNQMRWFFSKKLNAFDFVDPQKEIRKMNSANKK
jgi:hypothetical protein